MHGDHLDYFLRKAKESSGTDQAGSDSRHGLDHTLISWNGSVGSIETHPVCMIVKRGPSKN